jgi:hypothetical protein
MPRSREGSVDLGYGVDYREIRVRFPAEARDFYLLRSARTGFGAHSGVHPQRVTQRGCWNVHLASIFRIKACMMDAILCLYRFIFHETRRGMRVNTCCRYFFVHWPLKGPVFFRISFQAHCPIGTDGPQISTLHPMAFSKYKPIHKLKHTTQFYPKDGGNISHIHTA